MMIVDDPSELGKWIPVSYDVELRRKLWFRENENGIVEFHTETDVEPVVEANKALFNDSENKRWGDGQIIASIDLPTYYNKIVPAKQAGDDAWIKRWLNDSDNRAYRTFKGRV